MNSVLFDSLSTFTNFVIHLGIGFSLLILFIVIYLRVTPYRELQLIKQGNIAAAISLSGALIGFVLPIASVINHSVNFLDLAIWAFIAFVVQFLAYITVSKVLKDFTQGITDNKVSYGIFLANLSVVFGIINAVCLIP